VHHTTEKKQAGQGFYEYSIGEVSKQVDLSQKTIRDYEKMGLIKPRRNLKTNNRIYSNFEIGQIRQISRLIHNEGFTLPCIRRLLQLAPCWNIFDCEVKERCPAYEYSNKPCYEVRKIRGTLCGGVCQHCSIYINRSSKKQKVLEGPLKTVNGHTNVKTSRA
jgi:DNA-binding transcriptional MerR regulator